MSETSRIHIRDVLPSLCQEQKRVFRQLETVKKKIVNAHYAVVFNQTCITENLLPYFTNVRLYDRAVQRSDLTLNFRKKLVEEEITRKKQDLRSLYVEIILRLTMSLLSLIWRLIYVLMRLPLSRIWNLSTLRLYAPECNAS